MRVQRGNQSLHIRRPVLAVGIEGYDDVGALPQRTLDAGLQRSALPQIDGMLQHRGAGIRGCVAGVVTGAVVDDNDTVAGANYAGDNVGDHLRLVIGGDHHKNARHGHRSSRNEQQPREDQSNADNQAERHRFRKHQRTKRRCQRECQRHKRIRT